MARRRLERARGGFPAPLLLFLLIGGWPLVRLGRETAARTWGLSVIALALGVVLAVWLRSHLTEALAAKARARAVRIWVIAATAAWVLIAAAPSGVRMIYSAAIEGVICAVVSSACVTTCGCDGCAPTSPPQTTRSTRSTWFG
jgi:hypothetical protein